MAKNWAIVVGINQYEFLQPLQYAKRDAELMAQFLSNEAEFERVFLFSDNSPEISGKSTRPFRANLLRLFREIFETPFMGDGDNFWFFFAGHGIRHADRDYLMPLDGDPHDIENTGIPTHYLTDRLRRCGADNVVMLLDACRNTGSRAGEGIGTQTAEEARQTGVISIFGCSPNQFSHEVEELQQGAFTYALLEGLGIRGRCATVERLNQYLEYRVPEILRNSLPNARQTPYTIAEPANRLHLILMPRYASLAEISVLKNDAYQAEVQQNWKIAEKLWIRILAAASGQDMEAVKALQRISINKIQNENLKSTPPSDLNVHNTGRSSIYSYSKEQLSNKRDWIGGTNHIVGTNNYHNLSVQDRALEIDLASSRKVNYSKLRDLLKAKKWKEADAETFSVLLRAARKLKQGYLDPDSIEKFPCTDLRTVDQLWLHYSGNRFGISTQLDIWEKLNPQPDCIFQFGDSVKWSVQGQWLPYSRILYDATAVEGHLPWLRGVFEGNTSIEGLGMAGWEGYGEAYLGRKVQGIGFFFFLQNLMLRAKACRL
jgi:uncharacterized caspase-like protein